MYAYQLGRVECRRFGVIPSGLSREGNLHLHWLEMVCCIALSLFGFLLHSLQYKLSKLPNLPTSHLKVLVVYIQQWCLKTNFKLWLVSRWSSSCTSGKARFLYILWNKLFMLNQWKLHAIAKYCSHNFSMIGYNCFV